jgi:hypothetical protein
MVNEYVLVEDADAVPIRRHVPSSLRWRRTGSPAWLGCTVPVSRTLEPSRTLEALRFAVTR